MVEAKFGEDYLSVKTSKDADIFEICAGAQYVKIDDVFNVGKKKRILNIPVLVNGQSMIWSPSNKQGRQLIEKWGKETDRWIGKKIQLFHLENKMLIKPL
ncbi:MAG: hypothetical protein AABY22_24225 [Nanoarchaeota archaeon]